MTRRRARAIAALTALVLGGALAPTPAAADTAPPTGTLPTVSADGLPTWQINGVAWSQVVVGNVVYVTGSFTRARPPGVAPGGAGEVAAQNLFAYDIRTGNRVSSFNHSLNAQGRTLTRSPDGTRVFVGGDFTTVDGQARGHVAAFDTATGALVSTFKPNVNSQVRALAATASTLYVGGSFQSVNGTLRKNLAAVATGTGALQAWKPTAENGIVWSMVVAPDQSRVVVGGSFTTLNTKPAYGMGSISTSTGGLMPWAANQKIRNGTNTGAITSLRTDGRQIYGSGYAFGAGSNFEGTFAANPTTGALTLVNDCHGDTYDVLPVGGVLYSVSHAHNCTWVGGFPDTSPRVRWQMALAQTITPTRTNTGPDVYGWNYSGLPASTILHWFPQLLRGTYTGQYQAAWSVVGNGTYVAMAGEFLKVNGVSQQGLTRMAVRTSAPNKVGPTYTTTPARPVPATTATRTGSGSISVSFGTAWDYDNQTLTYELLRDGGTTPVRSTTVATNFWTLPTRTLTDTVPPGTTHTYQVRVKDALGNTVLSPRSAAVTG